MGFVGSSSATVEAALEDEEVEVDAAGVAEDCFRDERVLRAGRDFARGGGDGAASVCMASGSLLLDMDMASALWSVMG